MTGNAAAGTMSEAEAGSEHLSILDGWRGISILLVLAAHLLPLGPAEWQLNVSAGILGMVFFFVLSGFLVTRILLRQAEVGGFLIRRLFRIVPLAWAYLLLMLAMAPLVEPDLSVASWAARFLFYANLVPTALSPLTAHLWSLGVEVQFYFGIALLVLIGRQRALLVLPLLCLGITAWRIADGMHVSILTQYRIDEILAGASLALIYQRPAGDFLRRWLARCQGVLALIVLLLACHPATGPLNYLRPYLAAFVVGSTLLNPDAHLGPLLRQRTLAYIASISYALYVIHPVLAASWLGDGIGWDKYSKRPLLFLVLWLVTHLVSRHFERRCIALGKRLARRCSDFRIGLPTRRRETRIAPQENET